MPSKVSRESLIADLQRIANALGRTPLVSEYEHLGQFSVPTFRKTFGSWLDCLAAAGLQPGADHRHFFTDSDVRTELSRLTELLGHAPSWSEIKLHSSVSPDTFGRRLGKTNFTDPRNPPLNPDWSLDKIDPEIGGWVSGLVTGEGSFSLHKGNTSFHVVLRADDREILDFIRQTLDLPSEIGIYSNVKRRRLGQQVGDEARLFSSNRWVAKLRLLPFFEHFQLRGRKAMDFRIFAEAIRLLCKRDDEGRYRTHFTSAESEILVLLESQLKASRHDPTSVNLLT